MDYRTFIEQELRKAANMALRFFGKVKGTTKPDDNNQVLTETDIAIGQQLVAAVQATYPDYNVIDEEAGAIDKKSRYTWVIDPIEATSNFASGLPDYGIMIGLLENSVPIAGGIIIPAFDRLYLAEKGKGATCNGQPIHVTSENQLSQVLVSFGMDSHANDPGRTRAECQLLADVILVSRNFRNSGCEAVDPMRVAEGSYGARINMASKIWDNVAPQIICEEAGAIWTAHNGLALDYTDPLTKIEQNFTFCVASPALHEQLQTVVQKHGGKA